MFMFKKLFFLLLFLSALLDAEIPREAYQEVETCDYFQQGTMICIPDDDPVVPPGIWLPNCDAGDRLMQGQGETSCTETTPVDPPGLFLPSCATPGHRLEQGTEICIERQTLKKTGQTTSYADFDDGYYQIGITHSYTRDDTNNTVTDNISGLMWQDDEAVTAVTKTWNEANTYCSDDVSTGGYSDWRLPTRVELIGIVDYGLYNPAINTEFQNSTPFIHWSSTTYAGYAGNAWLIGFTAGNQSYVAKTSSYVRVRCVRGEKLSLSVDNNFSRANGIVTDNKTHLQWQDDYSDNGGNIKSTTWTEAVSYCEALSLDGGSWRLPNINELISLLDDTTFDPAISDAFLNITSSYYLSSTSSPYNTENAWVVDFQNGAYASINRSGSSSYNVRCARGGK